MKVLQVLPALDAGGVERGTLEIAEALVRDGHSAWVMSAGGRMLPELTALGATHLTWPIGRKSVRTLFLVRRLRRLFREQRFDIVHVRSRLPAWIVWLAWRGLPAPRPRLLTTVHGLYSVNAYSAIMTCGERVIAVSNTVRDYLCRNYPKLDARKIQVIPRGVRRDAFPYGHQFSAEWRAKFVAEYPALAGEEPWICLPGRGTRLKGHEAAIALIAALKAQGCPAKLILLGARQAARDAYGASLDRQIDALGLQKQVVLTAPRADVREVFAACQFVLQLSSKPEAFGRTVIEALALGVPVLGYGHGGVGELLAELFPAGLCALGDQRELLTRARAFLEQRPRVTDFAHYDLADMQTATLSLYRSLLESQP